MLWHCLIRFSFIVALLLLVQFEKFKDNAYVGFLAKTHSEHTDMKTQLSTVMCSEIGYIN